MGGADAALWERFIEFDTTNGRFCLCRNVGATSGAAGPGSWHLRTVNQRHRFRVDAPGAGLRLDQAISAGLPDVSRTLAKRVLLEGGVFVDRKRVKVASRLVREGQWVEVHVAAPSQKEAKPSYELPVLHESASYLVVDKPSGLCSAPTPESDMQDVLALLKRRAATKGDAGDLFLVHRLDRPTSGLMVVAKTKAAAAHLSLQAASHQMQRIYDALLFGTLAEKVTITEPIEDREAVTTFTPLASYAVATRVRAELLTGRTHQVRIHATHMGTPILGDSKYGRSLTRKHTPRPPRLGLHARTLAFLDPDSEKVVEFHSDFPEDLAAYERLLSPQGGDC